MVVDVVSFTKPFAIKRGVLDTGDVVDGNEQEGEGDGKEAS